MKRVNGEDLRDHLEQLLDQALEASFPASDPVSVSGHTPEQRPPAKRRRLRRVGLSRR